MKISYSTPLEAVFLRILSWENHVARRSLKVGQVVVDQIQIARREIGLPGNVPGGGGAPYFLSQLRNKGLLAPAGKPPVPTEKHWTDDRLAWRLRHAPSHYVVRQLSLMPVHDVVAPSLPAQRSKTYLVTLRNPATPQLRVVVGAGQYDTKLCDDYRGVYMLRFGNAMYLGQTDELPIRYSDHIRKKGDPEWWLFASIDDKQRGKLCPVDVIAATEGLLISFWNEVSCLTNSQAGRDRAPAPAYLQQAVLLANAVAAVMLWLTRDERELGKALNVDTSLWHLPFKKWPGQEDWPDCYIQVPENKAR